MLSAMSVCSQSGPHVTTNHDAIGQSQVTQGWIHDFQTKSGVSEPKVWGRHPIIWQFLSQNCMKL